MVESYAASRCCQGLTDGGEDACEAEIVHSVEREQMEQKLFPFFLAEQECMGLVQLPVRGQKGSVKIRVFTLKKIHIRFVSTYL